MSSKISSFKEKSGLSSIMILATTAGAVTMSVISNKLASFSGSILVTAVVSAVAVVINGLYKAVFSTVTETIQVKTFEASISDGLEDKESDTIIEEKTLPPKKNKDKPKSEFWQFIKKNNFWLLLTLFITISLITIGITSAIDKSDIVINKHETKQVTEVQKEETTKVEEISEEKKEELVKEVLETVEEEKEDVVENEHEEHNHTEETEQKIAEMDEEHDNKLDGLSNDFQEVLDQQKQELDIAQSKIEKLEQQVEKNNDKIEELEKLIKDLESSIINYRVAQMEEAREEPV